MKKIIALASAAFVMFALANCAKSTGPVTVDDPDNGDVTTVTAYSGTTQISVPCGTKVVYVHYKGKDGDKVMEVPVTPSITKPSNGKALEPFGTVQLTFEAPSPTAVSVSYRSHQKGDDYYCLENFAVTTPKTKNPAATTWTSVPNAKVNLPEPAAYVTADGGRTNYHSSGVVMFEDSWPNSSQTAEGKYDTDFNDCVLDYDLEASVVDDDKLEAEGWREQVKVVLHIRAIGASAPHRVGLILEDFDMNNVEYIEEFKTLDSYNNPHGTLPEWTKVTLQENSLHYDPLPNTEFRSTNPKRPAVEIGRIVLMNDASRGAGTEEYTYTNGEFTNTTVFNVSVNKKWETPRTEQYDPDLENVYKEHSKSTLAYVQTQGFYNALPGYVNVAGGLYTYTVIYHMKARAEMTTEKSAEVKANMIKAVNDTRSQNFYIINKDYTPVHLSGYTPGDFTPKTSVVYQTKYDQIYNKNKSKLDPTVPYLSKEGLVWGVKCPVNTRHVWNKLNFSEAYPNFFKWLQANGEDFQDWYMTPDGRFLSCWW